MFRGSEIFDHKSSLKGFPYRVETFKSDSLLEHEISDIYAPKIKVEFWFYR